MIQVLNLCRQGDSKEDRVVGVSDCSTVLRKFQPIGSSHAKLPVIAVLVFCRNSPALGL